ncbi:hypothetical protein GQR58_021419 [Nymphon striatum]|nr:hypothetical protein GQR58_021419 [Nymphon striatum]
MSPDNIRFLQFNKIAMTQLKIIETREPKLFSKRRICNITKEQYIRGKQHSNLRLPLSAVRVSVKCLVGKIELALIEKLGQTVIDSTQKLNMGEENSPDAMENEDEKMETVVYPFQENKDCLIFNSFDDVKKHIKELEGETNTRFVQHKRGLGFTRTGWNHNDRISWKSICEKSVTLRYDGVPFILMGEMVMACHRGYGKSRKPETKSSQDDLREQNVDADVLSRAVIGSIAVGRQALLEKQQTDPLLSTTAGAKTDKVFYSQRDNTGSRSQYGVKSDEGVLRKDGDSNEVHYSLPSSIQSSGEVEPHSLLKTHSQYHRDRAVKLLRYNILHNRKKLDAQELYYTRMPEVSDHQNHPIGDVDFDVLVSELKDNNSFKSKTPAEPSTSDSSVKTIIPENTSEETKQLRISKKKVK